LIGVGDYKDPELSALPAVRNNLEDLASALKDPGLWGLPEKHCVLLPDPIESSEVAAVLDETAREAEDTFLVYFAGHGLVDGPSGELVLATRGTQRSRPRYTGTPYDWVREIVGRSRAQRRVTILDCCFSGRAAQAMADPSSVVIGQIDIEGAYVLASSPANSLSIAPVDARNTAFTSGLLQVMRDGVADGPPHLTLDDLYQHTLLSMVRAGRPTPTKLGNDMIGDLPLVRNAWTGLRRLLAGRRRPPAGERPPAGLHAGVRLAVSVVRSALGPTGMDAPTALDRATGDGAALRQDPGVDLVRRTMTAMRRDFGDGSATAAVIMGELVDGVERCLESGADSDSVTAGIERDTAVALRELGALALPGRGPERTGRAVATALGDDETAALVVTAAEQAGASNVEVVHARAESKPRTPDGDAASRPSAAELTVVGRLALDTRIVAPNATSGPLTLHDPYVLVSPDGKTNGTDLVRFARRAGGPLLIVAPRMSIFDVRSLLRAFADSVVVVRPVDSGFDWNALDARVGSRLVPGQTLGKAARALITADTTTVIGLTGDPRPESGRVQVRVSGPANGVEEHMAVRALAIVRAVTGSGTVPGGGTALYRAARALPHDGSLLKGALGAPLRQLVRNAGHDAAAVCASLDDGLGRGPAEGFDVTTGRLTDLEQAGVLDSLAMARGAVEHAVAMALRYVELTCPARDAPQ